MTERTRKEKLDEILEGVTQVSSIGFKVEGINRSTGYAYISNERGPREISLDELTEIDAANIGVRIVMEMYRVENYEITRVRKL